MLRFWPQLTSGTAGTKEDRATANAELTYFLHQKKPFSFNILKSDYFRNHVLMTNLIGTLVRADNVGKFNLHLAKSLNTSLDKLTWVFTLRDNLTCESGERITAESYAGILTGSLRKYAEQGRLLEFEKLLEAEKLKEKSSSSISGISFKGNQLIFKFRQRPEHLFERLSDPYFGYLCEGNFKDDRVSWASERSVVSSGTYKVLDVISDEEIVLVYRNGSNAPEPDFKKVKFKIVPSIDQIGTPGGHFVAQLNERLPERDDVRVIRGTPTFTVNVSLPIWNKSIFQSADARKYFFFLLYNLKQKFRYSDASSVSANSFFPLDQVDYFKEYYRNNKIEPWSFKKKQKAIVSISTVLPDARREKLLEIFKLIAEKMNFEIQLYDKERHTPISQDNIKPFDIRITSVNLGSIPYFSLLDMIFCSELGVRYSDYKGRVCSFVSRNLKNHKGPLTGDQRTKLHDIIISGGLLMPISHRSISFMYSKSIDIESVSSSALYPAPEFIRVDDKN